MMKTTFIRLACLLAFALISGCAVISPQVRDKALGPVSFEELISNVSQYKGQTVILGGYVVSVENQKSQTRIVALQTPLGVGQRPKSKDLSRGRLLLICKGFLDPEVYTKDRQITVGGSVLSSSANDPQSSFPYLEVQVEEIHLWAVEKPVAAYPYWDDDFWYPYPYPWWYYPHWHRHYR